MAVKVGQNGFGRIGRLVHRAAMNHLKLDIVAVTEIIDATPLAHLLKYERRLEKMIFKRSDRDSGKEKGKYRRNMLSSPQEENPSKKYYIHRDIILTGPLPEPDKVIPFLIPY